MHPVKYRGEAKLDGTGASNGLDRGWVGRRNPPNMRTSDLEPCSSGHVCQITHVDAEDGTALIALPLAVSVAAPLVASIA